MFRQPFNQGKTTPYEKLQDYDNINPHIHHHFKHISFIEKTYCVVKYMNGNSEIYVLFAKK